jgi:hypothetical protein
MDIFEQFLEGRAERPRQTPAELLEWLNQGNAPEVRLLKFDAWAREQLATRLDWAWAGSGKARRIEQCRLCLEAMVLELWRRGWFLDGKRLARRIEELLDAVAAYQRSGKVRDFWPYFQASVRRYVGLNAEEIRAEAMQAGAHVNGVLAAFGVQRSAGPSLPELIAQRTEEVQQAKAETLRQKISRVRARQAACKADSGQGQLL